MKADFLKIGDTVLQSNLLLAPLAGFTDIAFRRLCRDFGAGLTTTEMISVRGLCYKNDKTERLLRLAPNEVPSSVQLFGSEPADFAHALALPSLAGFDLIDINMGCPMPKITGNGDGSALLKNPALAGRIVETCVKTGRTVTVKVRLGIDNADHALSFCRVLQEAGARMVTVHGRTAKQLYTGYADWDTIGNIASVLSIPVVGNGDVWTRAEIDEKLSAYPVAGLMLGRGALSNPQIFCGEDRLSKRELIERHLTYALEYFPERYVVTTLRKQFVWYLKGMVGIKDIKTALVKAQSAQEIRTLAARLDGAADSL